MKITEKYAVLITHFSFQSANLLNEIRGTRQGGPERIELVSKLDALKECINDEIEKSQKELVHAFRRNKAAQLMFKLEGDRDDNSLQYS